MAELETLDVQGGEGEDGAESGGSAGGGREVAGADLRQFGLSENRGGGQNEGWI